MGRVRPEALPRSMRWREVVELLESDEANAAVAEAAAKASGDGRDGYAVNRAAATGPLADCVLVLRHGRIVLRYSA